LEATGPQHCHKSPSLLLLKRLPYVLSSIFWRRIKGVELKFYAFITSLLNGSGWSSSCSGCFTQGHPLSRRLGQLPGLSGLSGEKKNPDPTINRTQVCNPRQSLYRLNLSRLISSSSLSSSSFSSYG
jgi:hypothetical protein